MAMSPNKSSPFQFKLDGRRKTIRLGDVAGNKAAAMRMHLKELVSHKVNGMPLDSSTAGWLAKIGDVIHDRIARTGLIEPRRTIESITAGELFDRYIKSRTDIKERTRANLLQARAAVVGHFGDRRITADGADEWRMAMLTKYARSTAFTHVKKTKQVYRWGVNRRLVSSNPFAALKAGKQSNELRNCYVPVEDIEAVIKACPDDEWRLIFALARYAGLRMPSEIQSLKWAYIDWARDRMNVRSPKTEHLEGKAMRVVPIFAALRPYLEAAHKMAGGNEYVISRHRRLSHADPAIAIIKKAGIKRWPRLFQNLRASCETDLASMFPVHVVCRWIGNTITVAEAHYFMIPETYYQIAGGRAAESAARPPAPNGAQTRLSLSRMVSLPPKGSPASTGS